MLSRSRFMNNSMFSMMDFSPIVAFILISVLRRVIFVVFNMFYY
jgi:YggT family protein